MAGPALTHATIVIERAYEVPPDRIFAAFADPGGRARSMVTSDDARLAYVATDFRAGGHDIHHDGPEGERPYLVTTRYEDIVANRRIVSVETVSRDDLRASVSLITVEMVPVDPGSGAGTGADGPAGTRLTLTHQIVTPHGDDWAGGVEEWWGLVLDRLPRAARDATPA
ncbi:MAG: SRPBCC domain-containing protein [Chloroflexia bacterium]|nr:SRPBCC domain-containing protein [Chloroflexia bacterium]